MKRKISILVILLVVGICLGFRRGRRMDSAPLGENRTQTAFLIKFGLDDKEDVDWGGTVTCPACQIEGWQFDSRDEVAGD